MLFVKAFLSRLSQALLSSAILLAISVEDIPSAVSQCNQCKLYSPVTLTTDNEVTDTLSETDIPTGQGGFARDYLVELEQGENVVVDLSSDSFDSILTLLAADGSTIAENDDGPDGSNNSLLFTRIAKTGKYIIRVRAFGETGVGAFKLRVTRLRPVSTGQPWQDLLQKLRR